MSMKAKRNLDIAIVGISAALIIVLQALAEGLRVLGLPLSLALGLIPVLVVAQLRGWKIGAILGTIFGFTSFVIAIIQLSGIEGAERLAFNPLVTVLPRTLVGLVVGLLSALFGRIEAKKQKANAEKAVEKTEETTDIARENEDVGTEKPATKKKSALGVWMGKYLFAAIATLAGVLTNTIGFLSMFYAFGHGLDIGYGAIDIKMILATVVAINTVIESVTYVFIVPLIVQALKKAKIFAN